MIWTSRALKLTVLAAFAALAATGVETMSRADENARTLWGSVASTMEDAEQGAAAPYPGSSSILLLSAPLSDSGREQLLAFAQKTGLIVAAPIIGRRDQAGRIGRTLALTMVAPDGRILADRDAGTPALPMAGVTFTRSDFPNPFDTVDVDGVRLGVAAIGDAELAIPLLGDRGARLVLLTGGPVTPAQVERFARAARANRVALLIAGKCDNTPSCMASAAVDSSGRIDGIDGGRHAFALPPRWSPPSALGLPPSVPQPSRYTASPGVTELGRRLFFDKGLSDTGSLSCASCHDPSHGFSDRKSGSAGTRRRSTRRNTISLLNVAFRPTLRWDGYASSLDNFVKYPMSSDDEMGAHDLDGVVARVSRSPRYQAQFAAAFGAGPIRFEEIERALAAFMRTLVSGDSPFDRAMAGEREAMSRSAWRGFALFDGRGGCASCHSYSKTSPFFTDFQTHNTGLGWDAATSQYHDAGAGAISANARTGSFRTPTLRDVAQTAPYMHDGSIATLRGVIDYFDRGGGDGPGRDARLSALHLSEQDKRDIEAFLIALTGTTRFDNAGRRSSPDIAHQR
ncbi:cytochrome-c peroxidase [Sphingomonas sp. MMS12-HWE2-04]|uniref:cytochrome-c peroxidase n=1 Tax=Sphingomonas sp. MMS12-HWE2-04 TaxID=3234199 RepID=UPI00384D5E79